MVCSCCGKKRGFFASFEEFSANGIKIALCPDCSALTYRLRDAAQAHLEEDFQSIHTAISKRATGKATEAFLKWYKAYVEEHKQQL